MRSCDITTGVNFRLTPNGWYWMVTVGALPALACTTGIGNCPPARKLAACPEVVVRFGSASTVAKPCVSSASMTPPIVVSAVFILARKYWYRYWKQYAASIAIGEGNAVLPCNICKHGIAMIKEGLQIDAERF